MINQYEINRAAHNGRLSCYPRDHSGNRLAAPSPLKKQGFREDALACALCGKLPPYSWVQEKPWRLECGRGVECSASVW